MNGESEIRAAIRAEIVGRVTAPCFLVDEWWLPSSGYGGVVRVDVASITLDRMTGYEIKSERDSLRRLVRQVDGYNRVFDCCVAVVAPMHLEGTLNIVSPWWGVLMVQQDAFRIVRMALPNPAIDPESVVRLLWKREALQALKSFGAEAYINDPIWSLHRTLLRLCPLDKLQDIVRRAILARGASWGIYRGETSKPLLVTP